MTGCRISGMPAPSSFWTRRRGTDGSQSGEDKNDVAEAGKCQPCTPDNHPVVFAVPAGDYKTDTDEQAERGNRQEGALVKAYGHCIRMLADSVTHVCNRAMAASRAKVSSNSLNVNSWIPGWLQ